MQKLKYDLTEFLKKNGRFAPVVYLKDDDYVVRYEQNNEEVTVYSNSELIVGDSVFDKDCAKNIKVHIVDDLGIRRCTGCGELFIAGYVTNDCSEYYCSSECLGVADYDVAYWSDWGTEVVNFLTPVEPAETPIEPTETKISDHSIKCVFPNSNNFGYCRKWTVTIEDDPSKKLGCIAHFYDEKGTFVSSYYVDSLLEDHKEQGLILYLDCPYWTLDWSDLKVILDWMKSKTARRLSL